MESHGTSAPFSRAKPSTFQPSAPPIIFFTFRPRRASELGHHGEDVSFQSMLKKYQLEDPALQLLGQIVQAADSHPHEPHPAGEGLRWIAHGFSALGLSDPEILEREFIVYDALYTECKRRVVAAER
jgi:hypothetical protein